MTVEADLLREILERVTRIEAALSPQPLSAADAEWGSALCAWLTSERETDWSAAEMIDRSDGNRRAVTILAGANALQLGHRLRRIAGRSLPGGYRLVLLGRPEGAARYRVETVGIEPL